MSRAPGTKLLVCAVAAIAVGGCGSTAAATHRAATTATTTARAPATTTARAPATTTATAYVAPPAGIATVQLLLPLTLYTQYVNHRLTVLRRELSALRGAIAAGDRPIAQSDWLTAHTTWLSLGQDDGAYGAFGSLGEAIDGTTAGVVGGARSPDFTGFHRVELDLWRREFMSAAATDAAKLTSLVTRLTPSVVARDMPPNTLFIDSWVLRAHEILEDALRDSLSQEDDYGSNSDLPSVLADVGATREMLAVLAPLIEPRAPSIVPTAKRQLRALEAAVKAARGARGWPSVASLPLRRREAIDAATGAALETLAPVSELMQISGTGT